MAGVLYRPPSPRQITATLPAHTAPLGTEVTVAFASDSAWQVVRDVSLGVASETGEPRLIVSQYVEPAGVDVPRQTERRARQVTATATATATGRATFITARIPLIGAPEVYHDAPPEQIVNAFDTPPVDAYGAPHVWLYHQHIEAEGFFNDGIRPRTPNASFVSARFLPYDISPHTRVTARMEVVGGLDVRHSWGAEDQFVATYGFNAAAVGSPWTSFSLRTVAPAGVTAAAFGLQEIRNVSHGLFPSGILPRLQFGTPSLQNLTRFIAPLGAHVSQYGTGRIYNLKQFIGQAGAIGSKLDWGKPQVYNRNQYAAAKGASLSAYGTALVQHGIRFLVPPSIQARSSPSDKAWASFRTRSLGPRSIEAPQLATQAVGGTRYVEPVGYEATRWGTRIIPESQTLFPLGIAGAIGVPTAWLYLTRVHPSWIFSEAWGQSYVWNSRQIVSVPVDHQGDFAGEKWSIWTRIENRNKVVQHHSTSPSELPRPTIANRARLLVPSSITAPSWPPNYKAGSVTYAQRYFPMDGIESPYIGRWHAVHNGAAVFDVQGFDAAQYGTAARLSNTRRYFPWITGGDMAEVGEPFIADRIRGVEFEARHTIEPPLLPEHDVHLYTRYVEPEGYEAGNPGWASLEIRWNKFTPRWTHRDFVGEPALHNVTPELRTRGRNSEELGEPSLRTQWREIFTLENYSSGAGRPVIGFRDRKLPAEGWRSDAFGRLTAIRIGEDPPHTRTIAPRSTSFDMMGFGKPDMNYMLAYPDGWDSLKFSTENEVILMGVQPEGIKPRSSWLNFGMAFVDDGVRVIRKIEGVGRIGPRDDWGKPDLAHRTIWVMYSPPSQAVANHGGRQYEAACEGIVLGRPTISKTPQYIGRTLDGAFLPNMRGAGGNDHALVDRYADLSLRRQYIVLNGWRSYVGGYHWADGGDRTIKVALGSDTAAVGRPRIAHEADVLPVNRQVKPASFSGSTAAPMVEHFHREIFPQGVLTQQMGSSRGGTLYYPQSLHVGFRRPVEVPGFVAGAIGTAWVSFRVRDLFVPGLDQELQMEYDPMMFEGRMRVRNAMADPRPPDPPAQTIGVVGIDAGTVSLCDVRPGVHFIRPDGNAEQYRKNTMEIAFS